MLYKPFEIIATSDDEFDRIGGTPIRSNPRRRWREVPADPEFKGLRVKIALVRDPDYDPRTAPQIGSSRDVHEFMLATRDEVVESMWALILNSSHRVVGVYEIVRGQLDQVTVMPADILRAVLAAGARAFILVHNHPSGKAEPSAQDKQLTERVKLAAETLGVAMLDHIVLGYEEWVSFADRGLL